MIITWAQKYSSVVRMTWIQALEYKANTLVGTFAIISGLLIEYLLWKRIFLTRDVETINGFTFEALIVYIFFALMVGQLKSSWVTSMDMIESIRNGEMNKYLIRPISFFTYHFALFLGYNSLYFFSYISMCLLFPFIYPGMAFTISGSILGFGLFLAISVYISYGIYFIMVCFAFWFGEVRSLIVAYNLANLLFSGQIIPMRMFPESLLNILQYTPIPYLVDIPVSIALGYMEFEIWQDKLIIAIFWSIIITLLGLTIYRFGIRRYEGFGG